MPAPGTPTTNFLCTVVNKIFLHFKNIICSIICWGFFNGYDNFHQTSSLRKGYICVNPNAVLLKNGCDSYQCI